jgi:hypothetical protein
MIETLKIVLHSVAERLAEKVPELLGWSVATTLAIVFSLSVLETVNIILQMIVLLISIAVGIATFIYTRKKTKNLPHGND